METDAQRIRAYPAAATPSSLTRRPPAETRAWEVGIFGDLTDKEPELFGRLLEVPRNSRGTIFFDSSGGNVYVGLALASLIRLRGLDAAAVVIGECSSAALLPLAACRVRYVTPHSTLLFHPMRWTSEENIRLEEAAEWARHFKHLEKDLDRLLAEMFGCSDEQLSQWTHPGRFVTGRELVEAGLARMVDLFDGDVWTQMTKA